MKWLIIWRGPSAIFWISPEPMMTDRSTRTILRKLSWQFVRCHLSGAICHLLRNIAVQTTDDKLLPYDIILITMYLLPKKKLKALANIGIFPGISPGISMENGASWLERRISLKVSGISLRVSWISISQVS